MGLFTGSYLHIDENTDIAYQIIDEAILYVSKSLIIQGEDNPALIVTGSVIISGSIQATSFTGSFSGSFEGIATTASYVNILAGDNIVVNYENKGISISSSINTSSFTTTSSFNIFTSSIVTNTTFNSFTSSYILDSSSWNNKINSLNNWTSSAVLNNQTSSFVLVSQTSSLNVNSSSYSATSSFAETASYVNILAGDNIVVNYENGGIAVSASIPPPSYVDFKSTGSLWYGGPGAGLPFVRFYTPIAGNITATTNNEIQWTGQYKERFVIIDYEFSEVGGVGRFGTLTMAWNGVSATPTITDNGTDYGASTGVTWTAQIIGAPGNQNMELLSNNASANTYNTIMAPKTVSN